MAGIVHRQKGLFGETIYTDSNFRVIGYSRKGLFGEEVFLDRNMRYAGEKRKGILGEDVYLDRDWHAAGYARKGLPGETVYLDRNLRYKGRSGKLGQDAYVVLDGEEVPVVTERKRNIGADLLFLVIVFLGIAVPVMSALK